MKDHLGPRLGARPLHMFWLLDASGSMSVDGKIDALNDAMREAVSAVAAAAAENPGVELLARVITFAHDAEWHISEPTPIDQLVWSDVAVVKQGTTEVGLAVDLATRAIDDVMASSSRGLPPALVLVSDGQPTDLKPPSYGASLRALDAQPWGRKASKMAIGIGKDADIEALARFTGHSEIKPLLAANAGELRHYLRWASTVVVDEGHRSTAAEQGQDADPTGRSANTEAQTQPLPVTDIDEAPTEPPTQPPTGQPKQNIAPPVTDISEAPTEPPTGQPKQNIAPPVTDISEAPTEPPTQPPTGQPKQNIAPPPPPPPPSGSPVW